MKIIHLHTSEFCRQPQTFICPSIDLHTLTKNPAKFGVFTSKEYKMYQSRQRPSWLGILSQIVVTRIWLKQKRTGTSEWHFPFICMPCQIFSIWCIYTVGWIFSASMKYIVSIHINILKKLYLSCFCPVISGSRYLFNIHNILGQWALQLYHLLCFVWV